MGAEAVRQPAGLRAALRAGLLAGLDRPGRRAGWRAPRSAACSPRPARGAWRSCAVTLAFVVMAEFYVGSGMAAADRRGAARRGRPRRGARRAAVRRRRRLPDRRRRGRQRHADADGDRARPRHRGRSRPGSRRCRTASAPTSPCCRRSASRWVRPSWRSRRPDAVLYRRAWPLALPPLLTGFAALIILLAQS